MEERAMINLDALSELERKATPGEWCEPYRLDKTLPFVILSPGGKCIFPCLNEEKNAENAAFIVAMRNTFPKLIAELRAAREMIAITTKKGTI